MRIRKRVLLFLVAMIFALLIAVSLPGSQPRNSVREELSRLQNEDGVSIVSFHDNMLFSADFVNRGWKPLRKITIDSSPAEFVVFSRRQGIAGFVHGTADEEMNAISTIQAWSPDISKMVYWVNKVMGVQIVRLYDASTGVTRDFAQGAAPTWSPDGQWIAYSYCPPSLHNCTYFVTHPTGQDTHILFNIDCCGSPLLWSPDSRFVMYTTPRKFREMALRERLELLIPVEHLWEYDRLRVRRVADGAEDWLVDFFGNDPESFQWVKLNGIK